MKAGDEGKLFGSVGPSEIAQAVTETCKVEINKRQVNLSEGTLA